MMSRRLSSFRELDSSVQLFANFGDALGQQIVGDLSLHRLRQDGGGCGHRGVGRGGTDIGKRLSFGERDLALGGFGAPGDEVFHLALGFGSDALGIDLRRGDDVLGFALGAGTLGLVFFKQVGGLLLEAAGIVEFGLDTFAAMIERRQHRAVNTDIGDYAPQDDEANGDPEFRFGEHRAYPFKVASTARPTDAPSGATPVSRCTIAAAASVAMPRTLLIAASRVEAMVFSASASLSASRSSSVLRSASEAAFSFSRVSAPIACARERAAASSLS